MKVPSISIIIPSYNQGQFIEQTICSILDQEYPALELIIIDGDSKDYTVDIIKKYEDRIAFWVSEKDNGQTDAIIKGFNKANGDIITWLCSDDWLEPGSLDAIGKAFGENPNWQIVHGDAKVTHANGIPFYHNKVGIITLSRLLSWWKPGYMPPQPAIFFRRSLYHSSKGLNPALVYAMDYDLWLQFASKTRFHYIPVLIAYQRFHDDSKSCSGNGFEKFKPEWIQLRNQVIRASSISFKSRLALDHFLFRFSKPFRRSFHWVAVRVRIRWQITQKQLFGEKAF